MGLARHWPELLMTVEIGTMARLNGTCSASFNQARWLADMTLNVTLSRRSEMPAQGLPLRSRSAPPKAATSAPQRATINQFSDSF
jgi:hypothetical protein